MNKILILIILTLVIFCACNDDIFYRISAEIPLIEPRIKGSPTNFVMFTSDEGEMMYVATRSYLFSYDNGTWIRMTLDMNIIQLAVTENYLYALCYLDSTSGITRRIKRMDKSNTWEDFPDTPPGAMQSIFSANNIIYIGVQDGSAFSTYTINASDILEEMIVTGTDTDLQNTVTSLLNGAGYNGTATFLCFKNSIMVNGALLPESMGYDFEAMITLPDGTIAVITRLGNLHTVTAAGVAKTAVAGFNNPARWLASGAIAIWENEGDYLLLVGRQDRIYTTSTGFSHGYMELELNGTGGLLTDASFKEPGTGSYSSVFDNDKYASSLGTIPVNHLFQAPNGIIFASTQKSGVYSHKDRGDGIYWNAEE